MGTLANGIKDIFSTSQTTATHLPVCASDGTPQGRISVSDLASVLGVFRTGNTLPLTVDVNAITTTSAYNITGYDSSQYAEHLPDSNTHGILVTFNGGYYKMQLFEGLSGKNNPTYIRLHDGNWGVWRSFALDFPSFYKNYNDLSSLASALGVRTYKGILATNSSEEWVRKTLTLSSDGAAMLVFIPNGRVRCYTLLSNRTNEGCDPLMLYTAETSLSNLIQCERTADNHSYIIGMQGAWSVIKIFSINGSYTVADYNE